MTNEAFQQAKTRREQGIVSSILHADRENRDWADAAFAALIEYAVEQGEEPFTIEKFREHAVKEMGLPPPPDGRAFGGITVRAIRRGILRRVDFGIAHSSNNSPKARYVKTKKRGRPAKATTEVEA